MIDKTKIETGVRLLLEGIGEDPQRLGLRETPQRVATMFEEIFSGIGVDPQAEIKVFPAEHHEMIIHRDIPFYSMCEHHLLPFWGFASIAYIPNEGIVTGFSSLARIVRVLAQRPQLQERMVTGVADAIMEKLKPMGVLVIVRAQHLRLMMRGEKVHGSWTVTSAVRGAMAKEATRLEALHLMDGHHG